MRLAVLRHIGNLSHARKGGGGTKKGRALSDAAFCESNSSAYRAAVAEPLLFGRLLSLSKAKVGGLKLKRSMIPCWVYLYPRFSLVQKS